MPCSIPQRECVFPQSLTGSSLLSKLSIEHASLLRNHVHLSDPQFLYINVCRSLPYKISAEDMYDIFGKYGAIRQIRLGTSNTTRGTAYVVYEDIFEAKNACESLNGFQVAGRYLIVRIHAIATHHAPLRLQLLTFSCLCLLCRFFIISPRNLGNNHDLARVDIRGAK